MLIMRLQNVILTEDKNKVLNATFYLQTTIISQIYKSKPGGETLIFHHTIQELVIMSTSQGAWIAIHFS